MLAKWLPYDDPIISMSYAMFRWSAIIGQRVIRSVVFGAVARRRIVR